MVSMAHAWNGCSQSSRFPTADQGERSSGDEIEGKPSACKLKELIDFSIFHFPRDLLIKNVLLSRHCYKFSVIFIGQEDVNRWSQHRSLSLEIINLNWELFCNNWSEERGRQMMWPKDQEVQRSSPWMIRSEISFTVANSHYQRSWSRKPIISVDYTLS